MLKNETIEELLLQSELLLEELCDPRTAKHIKLEWHGDNWVMETRVVSSEIPFRNVWMGKTIREAIEKQNNHLREKVKEIE